MESFAAKIEDVINRMTALEVAKLGLITDQSTLVRKILMAQGLAAFKKRLKKECQQAVYTARPETLEEAIQVAAEVHSMTTPVDPARVMQLKIKCLNCNKMGHMAKDCRSKKSNNNQKQGQNQYNGGNNVQNQSCFPMAFPGCQS
jgi:hypothetical protein